MSGGRVVVGLGNDFRRDDGVGLRVVDSVRARQLPGVLAVSVGEPAGLLDVWSGADIAVVVDAAIGSPSTAGRVRRWPAPEVESSAALSSHGLGLSQTVALGRALDRMPHTLVLFTVDVTDTGHGTGLSWEVESGAAQLVDLIVAELGNG